MKTSEAQQTVVEVLKTRGRTPYRCSNGAPRYDAERELLVLPRPTLETLVEAGLVVAEDSETDCYLSLPAYRITTTRARYVVVDANDRPVPGGRCFTRSEAERVVAHQRRMDAGY